MSKHSNEENKTKKLKLGRIVIILIITILLVLNFKFHLIAKAVLIINPILIEKIEINTEKLELEPDESIDISKLIYPEDYSKSDLVWHSTDSNVLEIIDGKVIGKSPGKASIYLADNESGIKSNEIEIECLIKVEEVKIENLIEKLELGEIYTLETKVFPENATYRDLEFESSNLEVLTVDNSGNLIANAIGKVTVSIKNIRGEEFNKFDIEVVKIPVDEITLDDVEVTLGKGQTYILNAEVTPLDATFTDVIWESTDTSVVKIENRIITAVGVGTADIVAITDEGDKKASCTFEVKKEAPELNKRFANGNYNIRTGASTDYKILATTSKYEEIEILQDTKPGWKKVRNSKGVTGYTLVKENYYLTEKPVARTEVSNEDIGDNLVTSYHIDKVPYLNQIKLGYPTGCEAVSATMVLKYKGYNVSVQDIVNNTKTGSKKYQGSDGLWYGANPFEEFVGHPSNGLSKGSYGVFAKPIADAMAVFAGGKVKNISGSNENTLFNYVSKGTPVVVWCVKNAGSIKEGVTWNYEGGTFKELVGEHCAVLIGYDENYVYLNDPSAGENVKQPKSKFISNWKTLFSQAIVVE